MRQSGDSPVRGARVVRLVLLDDAADRRGSATGLVRFLADVEKLLPVVRERPQLLVDDRQLSVEKVEHMPTRLLACAPDAQHRSDLVERPPESRANLRHL